MTLGWGVIGRLVSCGCGVLAVAGLACKSDEPSSDEGRATNGGGGALTAGGSAADDSAGGAGAGLVNNGGAPSDTGKGCLSEVAEAKITQRPIDILFVIDNSSSMGGQIAGTQNSINKDFAAILDPTGIDYRVIMLSQYGSKTNYHICIDQPLSAISDCTPPPPAPTGPGNSAKFFHYSSAVNSRDAWCVMRDAFANTIGDQFGLATSGISSWVRPEAFKFIVVITDDDMSCAPFLPFPSSYDQSVINMADAMDNQILTWAGFGTKEARNYTYYSIVGVKTSTHSNDAWLPSDPGQGQKCAGAVNPGFAHQALSIQTGGLRFSVCATGKFDQVFQEIAKGVTSKSAVKCEFPLPDAPPGEIIDLATVSVEYAVGGSSTVEALLQVPTTDACTDASFVIQDGQVKLCPAACDRVQADDLAKLSVRFDCVQPVE